MRQVGAQTLEPGSSVSIVAAARFLRGIGDAKIEAAEYAYPLRYASAAAR
jgi:hypothetical protein